MIALKHLFAKHLTAALRGKRFSNCTTWFQQDVPFDGGWFRVVVSDEGASGPGLSIDIEQSWGHPDTGALAAVTEFMRDVESIAKANLKEGVKS